MSEGDATAAVAGLEAAVDGLLGVSADSLAATELASVLEAVEVQRRRLEAVDQRLLAAASMAGVAAAFGQAGVADVLTSLLRIDPREARARVSRAVDLGPRRALTGERLAPLLPVTADAVAAGAVSAAQTDVIVDCLERIPPAAPAAAGPVAERLLVEAARFEAPRQLRRTAAELLTRLDPDGLEPIEDRADRRRSFTLATKPDGTSSPRGSWTAEVTAVWEAILDSLAAPQPAEDGMPDDRSPGQRRHDAMADAATRLLRSATLPAAGGSPVTVLATTTITDLTTAAEATPKTGGLALLGHGQVVSAKALLALAGEAEVLPVVFTDTGGILAYGTGRRLATRGQRLALAARDGGCSFPGCDRPAAWTEVHHVLEWINGGSTDLDNLCLVCRFHHRNFQKYGWQVHIEDGVPLWTPPPWLDAEQRPRRNTAHHRPDIVFRQPTQAA